MKKHCKKHPECAGGPCLSLDWQRAPIFKDKHEGGITIRQLKEFIKDWPEIDPYNGEEFELWVETSDGLSSPVQSVVRLNTADIIFSPLT